MKVLFWIACIGFPILAAAIESNDKTPEESQMCTKRVFSRKIQGNPDWGHMHHYCDGLRFHDRAVRTKNHKSDFRFNISNSLQHFDYVLNHVSKNFNMRPEVMVMRGRTMELAGDGFEAAQIYSAAIQLNPTFAMGYAALGNFYTKSGEKKQALKIYEEGLRRQPNNRYLRSRYKVLGGESKPEKSKQ